MMNEPKVQKILPNLVVWPSVVQTSSYYKVYNSVRLSAITLVHAFFGAFFRLYSAYCCSAKLHSDVIVLQSLYHK